jgi:sugar phosphate isomerase/epimerase
MFPTATIEAVFERIAKAGADGLDLFLPHVPYLTNPRFGPGNLELCRQAAQDVGLEIQSVIACSTPDDIGFTAYLGPDADKGRADAISFVKYNVEIATTLGARHICSAEGRLPQGADEKEMWNRLVRTLKEAAPILEEAGITFDLELHPGLIASTPEKAPKLIKEVGSEAVRICLDFCHANVITQGDPVKMIKALEETIGTIHISDGNQIPSLHLPIGQGEIDVDACIKAVKETGYEGIWVLCMFGCAFPELSLKTAVKFLKEKHPDILEK